MIDAAPATARRDAAPQRDLRRTLVASHFLANSLGALGIIHRLSAYFFPDFIPIHPLGFAAWLLLPNRARSPQELLVFFAAVSAFFAYCAAAARLVFGPADHLRNDFSSFLAGGRKRQGGFLAALGAVNLAMLANWHFWSPVPYVYGLMPFLWLGALLLPFHRALRAYAQAACEAVFAKIEPRLAAIGYLISALLCVQFLAMTVPFISGNLRMMNEFMDIPEQTLLDGTYVDNTSYINRHQIAGLLKYDPAADFGRSPLPRPGTQARLPKTASLERFIAGHKNNYYYDDRLRALVINRGMTGPEAAQLSDLFGDARLRESVREFHSRSNSWAESLKSTLYTPEEAEFVRKNKDELHWQILNRWVIHHHNFVLGPINEYALGRPLKDINLQYGLLNTVAMKFILEKTGGITYQNYFRLWFSLWPVYFILFFACAALWLQDLRYVLLTAVLALGLLNGIGYRFIFLGPGLNPVRHFFDALAAACLYFYLQKKSRPALLIALLFSIVAIANNREFGIFLLAALSAAVLAKFYQENWKAHWGDAIALGLAAVAGGALAFFAHIGKNDLARYYLQGLVSPPVDSTALNFIFAAIGAGDCLLVHNFHAARGVLKYGALFWFTYSQLVLFYYIWGATPPHLLNLAAILVFSSVLLLKFWLDDSALKRRESGIVYSLIAAAFILVYLPSLTFYYRDKDRYSAIFTSHKVYQWELDAAKFKSTMDPAYFSRAVDLIKKYSDKNAIYIISKYDNFLPFLSRKYSALPFPDLAWFLVTPAETARCIRALEQTRPPYLFVDTDMDRSFNGEVFGARRDPSAWDQSELAETFGRVRRLEEIRKIFAAVKGSYSPVERSELITVYKRIPAP